jgi:hypothetical protein
MSPQLAVFAAVSAAGLLALWLWVRLGERRPRSFGGAALHAAAALVVLSIMPLVFARAIGPSPSKGDQVLALLTVFLPSLTYMWLASLYVLEQVQRRLYAR